MLYRRDSFGFSASVLLFLACVSSALAPLSDAVAQAPSGFKVARVIQTAFSTDIAIGPDGMLYRAGGGGLEVIDADGRVIGGLSSEQAESSGVVSHFFPQAIAFDSSEILHILNDDGTVIRFHPDRSLSTVSIFSTGAAGSVGASATDMAMDADGNYYILTIYSVSGIDAGVSKFSPNGDLVFTLPAGTFDAVAGGTPTALAISKGGELHVLVTHPGRAGSVQVFDLSGGYRGRLRLPGDIERDQLTNLFTDRSGRVIVNARSKRGLDVLLTFSADRKVAARTLSGLSRRKGVGLVRHLELLRGLAFDAKGNMYAVQENSPIVVYAPRLRY